ncbi:hypothetical protein RINTU1_32200 [Candidatus Regiella insecticola]|uniref:Uncharacterized protein n=1 Tax=Candidatus Regiella insecticola TaxID=138073 RepID=A0A6L2ZRP9_9ENTR|nr:hypothetical protein RINTU1_32200 [Candidatus Regiella insecticola]
MPVLRISHAINLIIFKSMKYRRVTIFTFYHRYIRELRITGFFNKKSLCFFSIVLTHWRCKRVHEAPYDFLSFSLCLYVSIFSYKKKSVKR